ncbi:hypothetical protein JW921_01605 [Candidatus Fermentibacterales bacterium]|nr:hypothetical protein [Candidatus Fermentibacterales bacterium]
MMTGVARGVALLVPAVLTAVPAPGTDYGDCLELPGEEVLFSFFVPSGGEVVSILHSPAGDYVACRLGAPDAIELEFPEPSPASWGCFEYAWYMRPGMGGANMGMDLNRLAFETDGLRYEIYEDREEHTGSLIGLRVLSGDVVLADMAGDTATIAGSLLPFRFELGDRLVSSAGTGTSQLP